MPLFVIFGVMEVKRVIGERFIIEADEQRATLKYKSLEVLFWPREYEAAKNAIISGTILGAPDGVEWEKGDKLVFHFNIVRPDQVKHDHERTEDPYKIHPGKDDRLYHIPIKDAYCILRDDQIIPLRDIIITEPIRESNEITYGTLTLERPDSYIGDKANVGIIRFAGDPGDYLGTLCDVQCGDRIMFDNVSDIELHIGDDRYFRQAWRNILAVERDGEFTPVSQWTVVRRDPLVTERSGILLPEERQAGTYDGEVIEVGPGKDDPISVQVGDRVRFATGLGASHEVEYKGEKVFFVHENQIFFSYGKEKVGTEAEKRLVGA